jgi:hypothetical protein
MRLGSRTSPALGSGRAGPPARARPRRPGEVRQPRIAVVRTQPRMSHSLWRVTGGGKARGSPCVGQPAAPSGMIGAKAQYHPWAHGMGRSSFPISRAAASTLDHSGGRTPFFVEHRRGAQLCACVRTRRDRAQISGTHVMHTCTHTPRRAECRAQTNRTSCGTKITQQQVTLIQSLASLAGNPHPGPPSHQRCIIARCREALR